MFTLILSQSLTHSFRRGGGAFGACAFYILIITLFAFALGPDALHRHAVAVMCVAMLLASVTALPLLFERDFDDGTLEQYVLWPMALELVMLAKILGQWLAIILPILLVSPLMAVFAGLSMQQAVAALSMLLLASPGMVAVGAVAAALTLGARRGGLLQALITLPLYVPILIFAAGSTGQGAMLFLGGIALASLPLACLLCAALVKGAE
jgi:heme exporter protein B